MFKNYVCFWIVALCSIKAHARQQYLFTSQNSYLKLEFLKDDLIHYELTRKVDSPQISAQDPIAISPMIVDLDKAFPKQDIEVSVQGRRMTTTKLTLDVEQDTLCMSVTSKVEDQNSFRLCPKELNPFNQKFTISVSEVSNIYGLGERFRTLGSSDGDWSNSIVNSPAELGNVMQSYAGGAVGEAQFPVFYALGSGSSTWMYMLDSVYASSWNFKSKPFQISVNDQKTRGFISFAKNPVSARQTYIQITGKPPVPPKKMFGFWVSEYGYNNWDEVFEIAESMTKDHFPVDGFFLDLQWFGGVKPGSDDTSMGKLTFDEANFSKPAESIQFFKNKFGVGFVPIEESYIGKNLKEHSDLESRGYLAHVCGNPKKAGYLTAAVHGNASEWWGKGGIIDWTNPDAGSYWHKQKRQDLINLGVVGHWLDLGEPEMFDRQACYFGLGQNKNHWDIHNVFNLMWAKSVTDGYAADDVKQRPFMMVRSATSGIQRYHTALWSGDISGNLESLATHQNAALHLSYSGVDYYGSDIGGFHRNRADHSAMSDNEVEQSYTQWLAVSSWFDIPFRAHTHNLEKNRQTAPNKIGHTESNLFNIRQRYELVPYYYSLAHYAHLYGLPLMPPLSMMHPEDMTARKIGHQRYVGPYLMVALTAKPGEKSRDVYLPRGDWYNFRTHEALSSRGEWKRDVEVNQDGIHRLAVFARAGAIIPMATVDASTRNVFGFKSKNANELKIRIYPSEDESSFSIYDDDGETVEYKKGVVKKLTIGQKDSKKKLLIEVKEIKGWSRQEQQNKKIILQIAAKGRSSKSDGVSENTEGFLEIETTIQDLKEKSPLAVEW